MNTLDHLQKSRFLTIKTIGKLGVSGFLCVMTFAGCTSFQGPGELEAPTLKTPVFRPVQPESWESYQSFEDSIPKEGRPEFGWPVLNPDLSQIFRPDHNPYHEGIDLRGRRGAEIIASHSGTVVYVGSGFSGYGKMVLIEHNADWASLYAHLDKIQVREGQTVELGQQVGKMGRTGRATGVHLHFEILYRKKPINPLAVMPGAASVRRPASRALR